MSTQDNVRIVKEFFAATGRGDEQGLVALCAEDIEWIIPGEWEYVDTQALARASEMDPSPRP